MKAKCFAIRAGVIFILAIMALWIPLAAHAESVEMEARLARVFQDNMVLQREKPVPIWGWAKPGTPVEVSFNGQKKQAKADEHGYWKAVLEPMVANRTPQVLTAQIGTDTVSCKNVLVGEVWLSVNGNPMLKGLGRSGGKILQTTDMTENGVHFVTFDAPVDFTWVIVAEKGKATKFRKINRY